MRVILFWISLFYLVFSSFASLAKVTTSSTNTPLDYSNELTRIYSNVLEKYDTRVKPPTKSGTPVVVNVTVGFQSVVDVDETKMAMTIGIILTQSWNDPRLLFDTPIRNIDSISLSGNKVSEIWLPDTFIGNERSGFIHQVTLPNDFVRITRDGSVTRTIRMTVAIYCPFHYEYFPFGQHLCSIILGSNALTVEDIIYRWNGTLNENVANIHNFSPHSRQFFLIDKELGRHSPVFSNGKVSRLQLFMQFQRSWRPYIPRFFLPMALFTLISMFSLWIVDCRISLAINLFLIGFVNLFMGISYMGTAMPITTTKTALDVYFMICLFFISSSSVVCLLSIYFDNTKKEKRAASAEIGPGHDNLTMRQNSLVEDDSATMIGTNDNTMLYRPTTYRIRLLTKSQVVFKYIKRFSVFLCRYAKWILPFGFIITDIIYFSSNKKNVIIDSLPDTKQILREWHIGE